MHVDTDVRYWAESLDVHPPRRDRMHVDTDVRYWAESLDAPLRLARCPVCHRVVCRKWRRCKDRYGGGV